MDLVIKNGTVITSQEVMQTDVFIRQGKIDSLDTYEGDADKVIDAAGRLVMPGGVDVHTHLDMPFMGTFSSDDFRTGTIAAAMGGVTSIVDYVIPQKGESLADVVEKWHKKAKDKAVIDYGFHMAIVPPVDEVIQDFEYLVKSGITSIKCFLAYKDSLMVSDSDLIKLLTEAKKHRILVNIHAENGKVIDLLTKKLLEKGKTEPINHAYSRPPELEDEAVSRVIKFAQKVEVPVYFVHLSSKEAVKMVKAAKNRGQKVFAETCPQYLFFNENKYLEENFEGAKYVMSPPLRSFQHCSYLKKAVKTGVIDVIATDHCPFNFEGQKTMGIDDFTKIPNGAPGIETRMAVMFNEMVVKQKMPPEKFVELNCANPAKIFGLENKGDIAPGKDADIVIWNPSDNWIIRHEDLHENVDYTPYEGLQVTGKPETVISRGNIIVENGEFKAESAAGKFIHRT